MTLNRPTPRNNRTREIFVVLKNSARRARAALAFEMAAAGICAGSVVCEVMHGQACLPGCCCMQCANLMLPARRRPLCLKEILVSGGGRGRGGQRDLARVSWSLKRYEKKTEENGSQERKSIMKCLLFHTARKHSKNNDAPETDTLRCAQC